MRKLLFIFAIFHTATIALAQSPATGAVNGHDYVDLGLSVKWATCNIGASSPSDYGDYFAWGEAKTKDNFNLALGEDAKESFAGGLRQCVYDISNSTAGIDINCKTKVDGDKPFGNSMYAITCDSPGNFNYQCDIFFIDAAIRNLGYPWRMPGMAEFQELIDNCKCELVYVDNHLCHKYTSRKNGNSIILPIAGYRCCTELYNDGMTSFYWSSTFGDCELAAYGLYNFGTNPNVRINSNIRFGYPIRPVIEL